MIFFLKFYLKFVLYAIIYNLDKTSVISTHSHFHTIITHILYINSEKTDIFIKFCFVFIQEWNLKSSHVFQMVSCSVFMYSCSCCESASSGHSRNKWMLSSTGQPHIHHHPWTDHLLDCSYHGVYIWRILSFLDPTL